MPGFVIATHAANSHIGPLIPVARELIGRGHAVTWYTGERYRAAVERSGAVFAAPREGHLPDFERLEALNPEITRMSPTERAAWFLHQVWAVPAEGQHRDLTRVIADARADVLLADSGFWAANLVFDSTDVLWATVCQSVMSIHDPRLPPFGLGRHPGSGPIYQLRNRWAHRHTHRTIFTKAQAEVERIRHDLGLSPARGLRTTPYLFLQTTTPSFEYPRSALPPQVHFVGPLFPDPPEGFTPPPFWSELSGDRQVVLVTQGTSATTATDLLVPAVVALADSDLCVVVTTGKGDSDLGLDTLPANTYVTPFIPYAELMPKLAAVVTNGGYGTVQQALAHGLPLVLAGATEDKPEVAARVSWTGVGIDLRTQRPSPGQIRSAVRRVLTNPRYREGAERIAAEYARHDSVRTTAHLLEQLARTRSPVLRTDPELVTALEDS